MRFVSAMPCLAWPAPITEFYLPPTSFVPVSTCMSICLPVSVSSLCLEVPRPSERRYPSPWFLINRPDWVAQNLLATVTWHNFLWGGITNNSVSFSFDFAFLFSQLDAVAVITQKETLLCCFIYSVLFLIQLTPFCIFGNPLLTVKDFFECSQPVRDTQV